MTNINKKKWVTSIIAAFILSSAGFAFTTLKSENEKVADPVTYFYKDEPASEWDNPLNWQTTPPTGIVCSQGQTPCSVEFDESEYPGGIADYLDDFANVSALLAEPTTESRQ